MTAGSIPTAPKDKKFRRVKGGCDPGSIPGSPTNPKTRNSSCVFLDWSQLLNEVRTYFEQEFLP